MDSDKEQIEAARLKSERDYHNSRFGAEHDVRDSLGRWYAAVSNGQRAQDDMVRDLSRGKSVLEYGCADGALTLGTLRLDMIASRVYGIDISDKAIEKANSRARAIGATNCDFRAMNAEAMSFPDETFDVVFGRGIIHHLNLDRCFAEVCRVLRPGGHAIFLEPLGHNPVLNWYRQRTPEMRTADEHPIVMSDLTLAGGYFGLVENRYYGLTTLAVVPLLKLPIGGLAMRACERLDAVLFRSSLIRRNAWVVLMRLSKLVV